MPIDAAIDLTEEGELFWITAGDAASDGSDVQAVSPVVWEKATMPGGPFFYLFQVSRGAPAPQRPGEPSFWGYADGRLGFTWSDGVPMPASEARRTTGWQLRHTADGSNDGARFAFMFRPPASNGWRRLDLYVDCRGDHAELQVELGAAPGPHLQKSLGAEELCQDYLSADKLSVFFVDPWTSGLNVQLITQDDTEDGPGVILQAVTLASAEPPAAPPIPVSAYEPPLKTESKSASGCALGVHRSENASLLWLLAPALLIGRVRRRGSRSKGESLITGTLT